MKQEKIYALCMIAVVVSFLGFLLENLWLSVAKGFIDNRNMCLPFLLGYGMAVAAIYLLFGTPAEMTAFGKELVVESALVRWALYFLMVMVCVSVGEIALGTAVEKLCHVVWWDYTALPLHITRYTSIPTSMGFAFLITLFMDVFFEPLMKALLDMEPSRLRFAAVVGIGALTADFLYNAVRVYRAKEMKPRWRIAVGGKYAERIRKTA